MRVGILTAGGDCPGLNAVIRAASRRLLAHGHEPIGLRRGYRGLAERDHLVLDQKTVSGILPLGGTILSTSNYNPFREPEGIEKVRAAQAADPLDAVIAIGGEHTMMITRRLSEELGPARDRRAEDDRQRRRRHRLHVRLRHRRAGRDRRDRPPAHDRAVARPRDGRSR